jgi:hypothetical protein
MSAKLRSLVVAVAFFGSLAGFATQHQLLRVQAEPRYLGSTFRPTPSGLVVRGSRRRMHPDLAHPALAGPLPRAWTGRRRPRTALHLPLGTNPVGERQKPREAGQCEGRSCQRLVLATLGDFDEPVVASVGRIHAQTRALRSSKSPRTSPTVVRTGRWRQPGPGTAPWSSEQADGNRRVPSPRRRSALSATSCHRTRQRGFRPRG